MSAEPKQLPFEGIHHVTLLTRDLDSTIRFYCGVLEMRLVVARQDRPGRHCIFDLGGGDTIHFFEYPEAEIFTEPAPGSPWVRGVMQHMAFRVQNEHALCSVQQRVRAAGIEVTDIRDNVSAESIYFQDNNGITIEIARWKVDPTGRTPAYDNPLFFSDPDPLSAVREAMGESAEEGIGGVHAAAEAM